MEGKRLIVAMFSLSGYDYSNLHLAVYPEFGPALMMWMFNVTHFIVLEIISSFVDQKFGRPREYPPCAGYGSGGAAFSLWLQDQMRKSKENGIYRTLYFFFRKFMRLLLRYGKGFNEQMGISMRWLVKGV